MGFNWRQFLCTANMLLKQKSLQETHFRSAVSRAYYAAYHVAKHYAESKGGSHKQYPGSGSHEWVGKWYKDHGHKGICDVFFDLKERRRLADYEINPGKRYAISIDRAWALTVYQDALDLIKAVSQLP